MDAKQKLSMVKHISQKIFINKCSALDTKMVLPEQCEAEFQSFAADSLIAATTFVKLYEGILGHADIENETDVPS